MANRDPDSPQLLEHAPGGLGLYIGVTKRIAAIPEGPVRDERETLGGGSDCLGRRADFRRRLLVKCSSALDDRLEAVVITHDARVEQGVPALRESTDIAACTRVERIQGKPLKQR